jgi:hypothetical protein
LSNRRLQALAGDQVTFTAKDYAAGGRQRLVHLSAEEFLRRWVQHVLPRGFVKIRHSGLLANRRRTERVTVCRLLLAVWTMVQGVVGGFPSGAEAASGRPQGCPACGADKWCVVAEVSPAAPERVTSSIAAPDTA